MDIIVKAKNCQVTARLKDQAVEKVQHAARFFDRLTGVEVVFAEEHNPRIPQPAVVEVTGRLKGHLIRAQGSGDDHRAAVDAAVARFERQLSRYKARLIDRGRAARPQPTRAELIDTRAASAAPASELVDGSANGSDGARIVRTKTFELHPMLPEDAALQLELLDHDFYLFTNALTGDCNVLYRRKDGDLGLIVPAPSTATLAAPVD